VHSPWYKAFSCDVSWIYLASMYDITTCDVWEVQMEVHWLCSFWLLHTTTYLLIRHNSCHVTKLCEVDVDDLNGNALFYDFSRATKSYVNVLWHFYIWKSLSLSNSQPPTAAILHSDSPSQFELRNHSETQLATSDTIFHAYSGCIWFKSQRPEGSKHKGMRCPQVVAI